MLSLWANPDYDTALLLTMATGNITTNAAKHIREYVDAHIDADDGAVRCATHARAAPAPPRRARLHSCTPHAVCSCIRCRDTPR